MAVTLEEARVREAHAVALAAIRAIDADQVTCLDEEDEIIDCLDRCHCRAAEALARIKQLAPGVLT